ncbi:helix-turn-helix transcriptional regulator [Natrialba taiwanensis]|uniref:Transcription regulator n=1 Tax=Natrialba taiwanensis DSM 12281 TaxID=1230458 RepID=L9ZRH8_9EURY|nr:helix-turn-helix transcriptional regulator [Natrialba taiwanensis]ELY88954.1 transcription regulator [Natrialba taiwanensis DSM 12281]
MCRNIPTDHDDTDEHESSIDGSTPPRPLTNLTGFKRDQLFVIRLLAERNPHGLVIKDKLDCYYDEDINQGRLYQNLSELVDEGYVEKHPLDGRTNAYRPSTHANRRLEEHHEWERHCLFCDP